MGRAGAAVLTRARQRAEWRALEPVRAALRGWAFGTDAARRGRLAAAEAALADVPEEHRAAGRALIEDVRASLGPPPEL